MPAAGASAPAYTRPGHMSRSTPAAVNAATISPSAGSHARRRGRSFSRATPSGATPRPESRRAGGGGAPRPTSGKVRGPRSCTASGRSRSSAPRPPPCRTAARSGGAVTDATTRGRRVTAPGGTRRRAGTPARASRRRARLQPGPTSEPNRSPRARIAVAASSSFPSLGNRRVAPLLRASACRSSGAAGSGADRPAPGCWRARGSAECWTSADHKMLWCRRHRQTNSVRVCSPASRRVAPLPPPLSRGSRP